MGVCDLVLRLVEPVVCTYAFPMHKHAPTSTRRQERAATTRPHLSATHVVRPAHAGDVAAIHAIVRRYAAQGALLPRTRRDIQAAIQDYVVVVDKNRRVLACSALSMYSARDRGVVELFAMTSAEAFFESLGYERSSVEQYPEKLARYELLRAAGVDVVDRACYRKLLTSQVRVRASQAQPQRQPRRRAAKQTTG